MPAVNQITISNLNLLVRNAKHPDIPNYDALMHVFFGRKRAHISVFNCLMRWFPRAKRADGAVYKSARELACETVSSESSVNRAIPVLREIGFDTFLKKANGAPTNHFLLNTERFIARLATVFQATVEQIRDWLFPQNDRVDSVKRQNSSAQNDRNDSVKMAETITIINTEKEQQDSIQADASTTDADQEKAFVPFAEFLKAQKQKREGNSKLLTREACSLAKELEMKLFTDYRTIEALIQIYGIESVRNAAEKATKLWDDYEISHPGAWVRQHLSEESRRERQEKQESEENQQNSATDDSPKADH
jgi:hypothetical protein